MTIPVATLTQLGTQAKGGLNSVLDTVGPSVLTGPGTIPVAWTYLNAALNNLLYALEQDAGVTPGLFGSQGMVLPLVAGG